MGWGIEDGIKYWLIQDSYGKSKGENGFIKIKIGDDCGAGATAFCDEIDGKYNDYEEDTNKTIINNGNEILYTTKYFLNIFSLFLFIF